MPVPRVGIRASSASISGSKQRSTEILRTFIALVVIDSTLFGALMIGSTITG